MAFTKELLKVDKALIALDEAAEKQGIRSEKDPMDPQRRVYHVPAEGGRREVFAGAVNDAIFGQRLDFVAVAKDDVTGDAQALRKILETARNLCRARVAVTEFGELVAVASFTPRVVADDRTDELIEAMREVAQVAAHIAR